MGAQHLSQSKIESLFMVQPQPDALLTHDEVELVMIFGITQSGIPFHPKKEG